MMMENMNQLVKRELRRKPVEMRTLLVVSLSKELKVTQILSVEAKEAKNGQ